MFASKVATKRTASSAPRRWVGVLPSRLTGGHGQAILQRKCSTCEAEDDAMLLARKRGPDSMETDGQLAPPAVHEVLATSGTPLPSQERAFFEPGLVTTSVASVSVPISPRRR